MAKAKIISGKPTIAEPIVDVVNELEEIEKIQVIQPLIAEYDSDTNTIAITIKSGHHLTIREPRGKDFLEAEGWMSQADEDRRSISFLILRLVLGCATFRLNHAIVPKPKMEEFLDLLDDYESLEAAGKALNFFQDTLSDYFQRLEQRAKDSMDMPRETI